MRKRLFFPAGIAAEILLLLLIFCVWQGNGLERGTDRETAVSAGVQGTGEEKTDYIKWVEFNVSYEALNRAYTYDVETYQEDIHINWVELLAYLGAKYGGDFTAYQEKDMTEAAEKLLSKETTIEDMTAGMQYYSYYREAYGAVLDGMVGEYEIERPESENSEKKVWKKFYGLKAYSPIAKTFPYSDYDDFGVSRSYGYRRNHLGHDMMGQVGTPRRKICRT